MSTSSSNFSVQKVVLLITEKVLYLSESLLEHPTGFRGTTRTSSNHHSQGKEDYLKKIVKRVGKEGWGSIS
ncbi:hypothetical protein AMATHDRAFT_11466 [Amanita thiersii Skay4041]|uniref:Uncharacterized protein n=1 Tax=Amanita thiersii Skay4041 TaxID=703135 RepID=A0A2A9NAD0_9AGAR|nr:hypothetical protein AMATHDRAFT_11466 [Amanita thiersii Skay4041]